MPREAMRAPVPVPRLGARRASHDSRVAAPGPVLVAEAGAAGFYIAITRGLAPVLMAFIGLGVRDVMLVALTAYTIALSVLVLLRARGVKRLRRVMLLVHGAERAVWGLLPLAAPLGLLPLVAVYSAAVVLASVTGLLLTTTIYSVFGEGEARRVIAYRSAASAATNIAGQLLAILVLAAINSYEKYIYLYALASGIGLVATAVLAVSRLPLPSSVEASGPRGRGDEEAVSGTVFMYMVSYMASAAVLATAWPPYLIHVLRAPDYMAAGLGLVQMVTSIAASLYWLRLPYSVYKYAVLALPLVPAAVIVAKQPLLHLGLASLYAFNATGASLLASFLYARLSRQLGAFTASTRVAIASAAAQVAGLSSALAASSTGLWAVFASSIAFAALAAIIALYSLPEVALVPPEQALIHARRLYLITSSALGAIIVVSRKTLETALRVLALFLALLVLLLAYRILYYIMALPR